MAVSRDSMALGAKFRFGSEAVISITSRLMAAFWWKAELNQGHIQDTATTAFGEERSLDQQLIGQ
jgi:hypothetical protein